MIVLAVTPTRKYCYTTPLCDRDVIISDSSSTENSSDVPLVVDRDECFLSLGGRGWGLARDSCEPRPQEDARSLTDTDDQLRHGLHGSFLCQLPFSCTLLACVSYSMGAVV